ncbi:MAG: phosphatidylserine/phosphatidylglycerophosphate/cardiolipin synthase family protein [Alphaproteobacteria bacterium]|nr:MAG: phosphatidylserine/phosphatidylglycerophosphate/cardiolipin synthase family protein [Alphaproteobacteria bacterium]
MTSEELYHRLKFLVSTTPALNHSRPTVEMQIWFGQVRAALSETGDLLNVSKFNSAVDAMGLPEGLLRNKARTDIMQCLYNAVGLLGQQVPASTSGAFLPVGNPHDALVAIRTVLATASCSVRLIDPYANGEILETFATQAAEDIVIEILTDEFTVKAGFAPAVVAWKKQFTTTRPLDARLAPKRTLHDRAIIVDSASAWTIGQSFSDLATRSPTSVLRADTDTAVLKINAYEDIWQKAAAL